MEEGRRERPAKIGDQTLKAMVALGGEEIRNAIYPTSNVAQHSVEPGMYGDRTYADVAQDRAVAIQDPTAAAPSNPQRSSLLAEKIRQAEPARDARGREPQSVSLE